MPSLSGLIVLTVFLIPLLHAAWFNLSLQQDLKRLDELPEEFGVVLPDGANCYLAIQFFKILWRPRALVILDSDSLVIATKRLTRRFDTTEWRMEIHATSLTNITLRLLPKAQAFHAPEADTSRVLFRTVGNQRSPITKDLLTHGWLPCIIER